MVTSDSVNRQIKVVEFGDAVCSANKKMIPQAASNEAAFLHNAAIDLRINVPCSE